MKVPCLAISLILLANLSCMRASWTTAKIFNSISGGATVAATDSNVLLAQNEEATESLGVSIPLSQSSTLSQSDAPLMRDISMLTDILSDIVKNENPVVHELHEEFVGYGRQR